MLGTQFLNQSSDKRSVAEAVNDPQVKSRNIHHRHENIPGIENGITLPAAAFKFAKDGPRVDTPPARLGEHNRKSSPNWDTARQTLNA